MANKINQIEIDNIIYDLQDKDAKAPFTGTKAEVEAAIAAGEIKEGDIVNITDDVHEGGGGGGVIPDGVSNIVYLTQEEYDALPESKLTDDIEYRIMDEGTDSNADNVGYNNALSGLSAMNVQDAIDELSSRPSGEGGSNIVYLTQEQYDALPEDKLTNNIEYRISDGDANETARNISYDNTDSNLEAVNVQQAIDKLVASGGSNIQYVTQEEYDNLPEDKLTNNVEYRITDVGVNDAMASNIAYDNSESGIAALNVQGAIDKVNSSLNTLNTNLGGLRFGTDGDGNFGYYGADGSLIPFSVGGGNAEFEIITEIGTAHTFNQGATVDLGDLSSYNQVLVFAYRNMNNTSYTYGVRYDSCSGATMKETAWKDYDKGATNLFVLLENLSDNVSITFSGTGTGDLSYGVLGIKKVASTPTDKPESEIEITPLVPILTSNTGSDGGVASSGGTNNTNTYLVFDGSNTVETRLDPNPGAEGSTSTTYFQYKFTVPTVVKKVGIAEQIIANMYKLYTAVIQCSNDGTIWTNVATLDATNNTTSLQEYMYDINSDTAALYWRVQCTSTWDNKKILATSLQFYGYQMEALIWPMTSNTSADGECFASGSFATAYDPYHAFNGVFAHGEDYWGDQYTTEGKYIGYMFNKEQKVSAVEVAGLNTRVPFTFKIQGSNDGDKYVDLSEVLTCDKTINNNESNFYIINNKTSYKYYRLYLISGTGGFYSIARIQFYTAPKGTVAGGEINIDSVQDMDLLIEFTDRFPRFLLNDVSGGFRIESDIFKKMKSFTFSCNIGSHAGYYLRYYDDSNVIQNLDGNNVKAAGEYTFTVDCSKAADVTQDVFFIFTHTYARCESFKFLSYELL